MDTVSRWAQAHPATALLVLAIAAALGLAFVTRAPAPQAHPFVLGRQSLAAPTRLPNESPVHVSSLGGGMRASVRPEKRVRTVVQLLEGSQSRLEGAHSSWVRGDKVLDLIQALRRGLLASLGNGNGDVAVLITDPTDSLLFTLALVLAGRTPVVISPGVVIPANTAVEAVVCSAASLDTVAPLSLSPGSRRIVLDAAGRVAGDLVATGRMLVAEGALAVDEKEPTDVAIRFGTGSDAISYTHLNITAAIVSWLSVFPASPASTRPSINDVVLSLHHPSTPYGFGLLLLSLYTSASINLPSTPSSPEHLDALLNSSSSSAITLLFAPEAAIAANLYGHLLSKMVGDSSFIIRHARTGKLALLRNGIIARDTVWDWLLFTGVRKDAGLQAIRAVVLAGAVEQSKLDLFRLVLGAPALATLEVPMLLCPLTAGMMWDVQRLPPPGTVPDGRERGHVGPPTAGIEMKILGRDDALAGQIRGEIVVRAPSLPPASAFPADGIVTDEALAALPAYPDRPAAGADVQWLRTRVHGTLSPEGTLWLL